jgi:chromosome segregation ATPase
MSTTQYYLMVGTGLLAAVLLIALVVGYYYFQEFRNNLAVLHDVNDSNVSYSNALNAQIRDLTDMNQRCYLDAVEKDNVISLYDEAAGDARREIERITNRNVWQAKEIKSLEAKVVRHEDTMKDYNKLLNESHAAVLEAQVEIRNATEALEFLKSELEMAERRLVQQKLENEATVSYYKSQVAGSTRV